MLLTVPLMFQPTNCGGNSAALSYVGPIQWEISHALRMRSSQEAAAIEALIPASEWEQVFHFGWGVDTWWVRKIISPEESGPVVVCPKPFSNVPQPVLMNLYRKNPAHAAGFLHGRPRLISLEEFRALNPDDFLVVEKHEARQATSL